MGAVNTTYTFAANDTITSTKMNDIIDQTTFTNEAVFNTTLAVSLGKLKVNTQGITSNEMAANSVGTIAITDLNVTTAKLASSSVTADKLDASVGVARATLKVKTGESQRSFSDYISIPVVMSINTSVTPKIVTVTSVIPHGYLAEEPFYIHVDGTTDYQVCGFVGSVINTTSFTFNTTSTSIPAGTASIWFFDPAKYNSRNIKRVHPAKPVLNDDFDTSDSFAQYVQDNPSFSATFNTPLVDVSNACVIGSKDITDEVNSKWFAFYSPTQGLKEYSGTTVIPYYTHFSVAVFT